MARRIREIQKIPGISTVNACLSEFTVRSNWNLFHRKNSEMTLSEFKLIWFMEYAHRTWGRLIGSAYALPAAYFWYRGYFGKPMKVRVLVYGTLIGLQGLMGWYMVKSGLEDRFHNPDDVPRVSQYRLASHLSLAFVLYMGLLFSSLHHLVPAQKLATAVPKASVTFKMLAHSTKAMIFFTALSGKFTAKQDQPLCKSHSNRPQVPWLRD